MEPSNSETDENKNFIKIKIETVIENEGQENFKSLSTNVCDTSTEIKRDELPMCKEENALIDEQQTDADSNASHINARFLDISPSDKDVNTKMAPKIMFNQMTASSVDMTQHKSTHTGMFLTLFHTSESKVTPYTLINISQTSVDPTVGFDKNAGLIYVSPVEGKVPNVKPQMFLSTPQNLQFLDKTCSETSDAGRVSSVEQGKYNCNNRYKAFNSSESPKNWKKQTGKKPYECNVCQKAFTLPYHLRRHMTTHTGDKQFLCNICQKRFTANFKLKKHLRSHTSYRPYMCCICDKSFAWPEYAKAHMKRHTRHRNMQTDQKKYSCHICNKAFPKSSGLKTHYVVHTGEKLYKCSICHKSFAHKGGLTKHTKIHTGEKNFICTVCNKAFVESGNLKQHMRSHTRKKPYKCNVCNKAFASTWYFKKHVKAHLQEETIESKPKGNAKYVDICPAEGGINTQHVRDAPSVDRDTNLVQVINVTSNNKDMNLAPDVISAQSPKHRATFVDISPVTDAKETSNTHNSPSDVTSAPFKETQT